MYILYCFWNVYLILLIFYNTDEFAKLSIFKKRLLGDQYNIIMILEYLKYTQKCDFAQKCLKKMT